MFRIRSARPFLERLEDWLAPSIFTVTSIADTGAGTLRLMIQDSNATPGTNTIDFNIAGGGVHVIQPRTALPTITNPVTLDGTSEPGYTGTPVIQIDGSLLSATVPGLTLSAGSSTVKGFIISHFGGAGIAVVSNSNVIQANYIGTDATGKIAAKNNADGIAIYGGAQNNLIGTNGDGVNDASERNIISANGFSGVSISGSGTNQNTVAGNYIGTDVTGTAALGNTDNGVSIFAGAQSNRIGVNGADTDAAGEGNVISANHWSGIGISSSGTTQNVVAGNFIGLDATGSVALGNLNLGVGIDTGAQNNRIGTNADGVGDALERNIISANTWQGVRIGGTGTNQNIVAGNYIGTNKAGTVALGNLLDGVLVYSGAASNGIGSNLDGLNDGAEANLISGNLGGGVIVEDTGSNQNTVQGNLIGTDATGTQALGNAGVGVGVNGSAQANSIRLNGIYGNGGLGIDLGGSSVSINAVGDADTGPNLLQTYPVILSASPGSATTVAGTLTSEPSTTFTLDFYASAAPDRSLYGQGERYLGATTLTTPASGEASFSVALAAASNAGEWISATATDPAGNTSEFSMARPLPTTALSLSATSWTAVGPAPIAATGYAGGQPFSGKINALAADPNNPNVIYIATSSGGIWKTADGGNTWQPLTDGQSTLFMGAIALAPSNPSIIYAGTGDTTYSGNAFYGRGVLKSTDGGATWTLLANNFFDRRAISRIVVDPSNPNIVYMSTGAGIVNGVGGNVGVWKSTDGGNTWADTTAGIANINRTWDVFSAILMDPSDSTHQTLYTAVSSPAGQFEGFSTGAGVYKTINGGGTWTLLAGGMPSGQTVGHIELALSASAPQTVYASIVGTGQAGSTAYGSLFKMMKSTNSGANWSQLSSTPDYFAPEDIGWFATTLAVDPSNANIVYAGAASGPGSFIESRDGGMTWVDISLGSAPSADTFANSAAHGDHHAIGFDANGKLLDGDDGGIYRLDNPVPPNVQWTDLNGNLQITQFTGIALDPADPSIAVGGSQDNGTEIFNGPLGWTQTRGGDGGFVAIDPSQPATIYHTYNWTPSTSQTDVFERSDDGGATWTSKTTGLTLTDPSSFYPPYEIDPSSSSRIVLATNKVYVTTNRADNWSAISPVLSSNTNTYYQETTALAIAPTNGNVIFTATADGHVFTTSNDGSTWQSRDIPGLSNNYGHIAGLAIDPTNSSIVYAVRDQFNNGTTTGHVFRSADGGQNWTDISGNLPDLPTYAIALDSSTGAVYIGNDTGVFVLSKLGGTWSRFGAGLPDVQVVQLQLSPSLGILAAGTHGRGMWEIKTPIHYHLTPSVTSVTAGASFSVTVAVLDANNNPVSNYTGTIHFASTDARAILPADYTFTTGDAGSHTFTGVVLITAGSQVVTAADTSIASIAGTAAITVNPGLAKKYTFSAFPLTETAGIGHGFTLTARDAYGNVATSYTGTVHFTSSDPYPATLPADYTFTAADAGIHAFTTGAILYTAGTQSITATDTVKPITGKIPTITVLHGAPLFTVTGFPSPTTAGAAHTFTVTAKAVDAYGNAITGTYTGTAVFSSSDPHAVLPAKYMFTAADSGTHTFTAKLKTAGTQSITVHDVKEASGTGSQTGIVVTSGAPIALMLTGLPASGAAGAVETFTIRVVDAFGNTVTGYRHMVQFTSTDAAANLPANYTFTAADAGVHTFTVTFNTQGTETITATDTATPAVKGSESMNVTWDRADTDEETDAFDYQGLADDVNRLAEILATQHSSFAAPDLFDGNSLSDQSVVSAVVTILAAPSIGRFWQRDARKKRLPFQPRLFA
jgi:hypothetical protein